VRQLPSLTCILSWKEGMFFAGSAASENEFEPEPVVLQVCGEFF